MQVEYVTFQNDYNMSLKEEVFYTLLKDRCQSNTCVEKLRVNPSLIKHNSNLAMWKLYKEMLEE